MSMKLTREEKMDFNKMTRCLILQATQLIVDSRMEGLTSTPCNPTSDGSGFNLAIKEIPDVIEEANKFLNSNPGVITQVPLCIEISLLTTDEHGKAWQMLLESWCFGLSHDQCTEYVNPFKQAEGYRVLALLKSLVSVTRVTPAYKLSRRQGLDTCIINYKFNCGKLDAASKERMLGIDYKVVRVGQLCTPVGTMHLTLSYRIDMTRPSLKTIDNSINIKSDHYTNTKDDIISEKKLLEVAKRGAFLSHRPHIEEKPKTKIPDCFVTSLSDTEDELSTNEEPAKEDEQNGNSSPESQSSNITMTSTDGFIMVDLHKPLFNGNKDLNSFVTEFQAPESLDAFRTILPFEEQAPNFVNLVQVFEEEITKYNDMVDTLGQSQSANNN